MLPHLKHELIDAAQAILNDADKARDGGIVAFVGAHLRVKNPEAIAKAAQAIAKEKPYQLLERHYLQLTREWEAFDDKLGRDYYSRDKPAPQKLEQQRDRMDLASGNAQQACTAYITKRLREMQMMPGDVVPVQSALQATEPKEVPKKHEKTQLPAVRLVQR